MAPNPVDTIQATCRLADQAWQDPASRARSGTADLLEAIAASVEALGERLTQTAMRETHLPAARLEGERARTVGQLRLFARLVSEGSWVDARIDPAQPDRQPLPRPDLRRMLVPVGPVAVFGASNFPLAFSVAGGDTASALAAGCPVVCKAHPAHPQTSDLVASAITEAVVRVGRSRGTFTLVHTASNEDNLRLVQHPTIRAVGFTGSHHAGRALFDAAAARPDPIPVFAEMSSVNPMVLLPGALAERGSRIAAGLLGSFTLGVGQFCTKPGLVFCLSDEWTEAFLRDLADETSRAAAGAMLHAGIAASYNRHLSDRMKTPGLQALAHVVVDDADAQGGPVLLRTTAATVLANATLLEECFGPTTLVVVCDDVDQMARVIDSLPGQLTGTIHHAASDAQTVARVLPLLSARVGRVLFNGYPTGVEVCPAMQHGGPYPATSDARFTSVGTAAIYRWVRPLCYQNAPADVLPAALRDDNPLNIWRTIDGRITKESL